MKYFLFVTALVAAVMSFSACASGYVREQPAYRETARPPQPGSTHIWINDGWNYNRRTHNYVQRNGYWSVPRNGRVHAPGHWETNKRGHRWVRGR